jgi:hypothetical protein
MGVSSEPKACEFQVLRYAPDPFKHDTIDIGVMVLCAETNFADVRFTRDWARVQCLDREADIEVLGALEGDIRTQLQSSPESRGQLVARLRETLSNSLQITEPKGLLSRSPADDLKELARTYLDRARPKRAERLGARQRILRRMRGAFESAGVWDAMIKKIKASEYTHPGDPLEIDCGYRNGVMRFFHAVSLASEPDSAKILAFTYPELRAGFQRLKHLETDLTAVVEDDLDRTEGRIQFALHTLDRAGIKVAALATMPQFAEQARLEMRL